MMKETREKILSTLLTKIINTALLIQCNLLLHLPNQAHHTIRIVCLKRIEKIHISIPDLEIISLILL